MNTENYTIVDHLATNGNSVFIGDYPTLLVSFIEESKWLTAKTRKREVVYSRRFLAVELCRVSGMTMESIGKLLGGFDHATVLHHKREHYAMIDTKDKFYQEICNDVRNKIEEFRKNYC